MKIGVLALQGGVEEHLKALIKCGAEAREVRLPQDLNGLDGLIIPGGESTAISNLMKEYKLEKEITSKAKKGMPVFGSCAGAILLAKGVKGGNNSLKLMNINVERNAYGRQLESFESSLEIKGFDKKFPAVFIRAPVINSKNNGVEVLSEFKGKPVMVKEKNLLATTFHPELTNDLRVHQFFLGMIKNNGKN